MLSKSHSSSVGNDNSSSIKQYIDSPQKMAKLLSSVISQKDMDIVGTGDPRYSNEKGVEVYMEYVCSIAFDLASSGRQDEIPLLVEAVSDNLQQMIVHNVEEDESENVSTTIALPPVTDSSWTGNPVMDNNIDEAISKSNGKITGGYVTWLTENMKDAIDSLPEERILEGVKKNLISQLATLGIIDESFDVDDPQTLVKAIPKLMCIASSEESDMYQNHPGKLKELFSQISKETLDKITSIMSEEDKKQMAGITEGIFDSNITRGCLAVVIIAVIIALFTTTEDADNAWGHANDFLSWLYQYLTQMGSEGDDMFNTNPIVHNKSMIQSSFESVFNFIYHPDERMTGTGIYDLLNSGPVTVANSVFVTMPLFGFWRAKGANGFLKDEDKYFIPGNNSSKELGAEYLFYLNNQDKILATRNDGNLYVIGVDTHTKLTGETVEPYAIKNESLWKEIVINKRSLFIDFFELRRGKSVKLFTETYGEFASIDGTQKPFIARYRKNPKFKFGNDVTKLSNIEAYLFGNIVSFDKDAVLQDMESLNIKALENGGSNSTVFLKKRLKILSKILGIDPKYFTVMMIFALSSTFKIIYNKDTTWFGSAVFAIGSAAKSLFYANMEESGSTVKDIIGAIDALRPKVMSPAGIQKSTRFFSKLFISIFNTSYEMGMSSSFPGDMDKDSEWKYKLAEKICVDSLEKLHTMNENTHAIPWVAYNAGFLKTEFAMSVFLGNSGLPDIGNFLNLSSSTSELMNSIYNMAGIKEIPPERTWKDTAMTVFGALGIPILYKFLQRRNRSRGVTRSERVGDRFNVFRLINDRMNFGTFPTLGSVSKYTRANHCLSTPCHG